MNTFAKIMLEILEGMRSKRNSQNFIGIQNGFYVVMSSLRNFLEFVGVKVEKYPGMFGRIFAK